MKEIDLVKEVADIAEGWSLDDDGEGICIAAVGGKNVIHLALDDGSGEPDQAVSLVNVEPIREILKELDDEGADLMTVREGIEEYIKDCMKYDHGA